MPTLEKAARRLDHWANAAGQSGAIIVLSADGFPERAGKFRYRWPWGGGSQPQAAVQALIEDLKSYFEAPAAEQVIRTHRLASKGKISAHQLQAVLGTARELATARSTNRHQETIDGLLREVDPHGRITGEHRQLLLDHLDALRAKGNSDLTKATAIGALMGAIERFQENDRRLRRLVDNPQSPSFLRIVQAATSTQPRLKLLKTHAQVCDRVAQIASQRISGQKLLTKTQLTELIASILVEIAERASTVRFDSAQAATSPKVMLVRLEPLSRGEQR